MGSQQDKTMHMVTLKIVLHCSIHPHCKQQTMTDCHQTNRQLGHNKHIIYFEKESIPVHSLLSQSSETVFCPARSDN